MVFYKHPEMKPSENLIEMNTRELSRPLHNFSLPSLWGSQIRFRCGKVNQTSQRLLSFDNRNRSVSDTQSEGCSKDSDLEKPQFEKSKKLVKLVCLGEKSVIGEDGVDEIKGEVLIHLSKAADNVKVSILKEGVEVEEEEENSSSATVVVAAMRPWNLRKRIAAPIEDESPAVKRVRNEEGQKAASSSLSLSPSPSPSPSPQKAIGIENQNPVSKSLRSRGLVAVESQGIESEKEVMISLTVALSKGNIVEDYKAMFGRKLPRRPKKRPRAVRKDLDALFPGLWLSDITTDSYKVPDELESKKK
ncbi:hypothetical protein GIB67_012567 [Kingdonia uniflora]|uniref:DUF1639 family protein n=1 Tax=Kingdonia uniflora TaxID=39325 RepID=A0A7J7NF88_9MAGN|nr:hypothetical protein GIB67_012567 [Kingdonia uniflora]